MIENIQKRLSELEGISPDKWSLKGFELFAKQQVIKKRDVIAIDAKEISIGSEKIWVWAAVDIKDEMVMAVHVSYVKNNHATRSFLKKVAKQCKRPLPAVFVNGEDWSKRAFKKAGFRYTPVYFGERSAIEAFLLLVSFRIHRHVNKFAGTKTRKEILWWTEVFAGYTDYWTAQN